MMSVVEALTLSSRLGPAPAALALVTWGWSDRRVSNRDLVSAIWLHQVAENVLGNIHTHFINFKVDLDVLGESEVALYGKQKGFICVNQNVIFLFFFCLIWGGHNLCNTELVN